MYVYRYNLFFLCLVSMIIYSADDNSPESFMSRLQEIEMHNSGTYASKFTFNPDAMRRYMEKFFNKQPDLAPYVDYLIALATSDKIPDEQKITKQFLSIPYFDTFAMKSEDDKKRLEQQFFGSLSNFSAQYALERLIIAGLCDKGIDMNATRPCTLDPDWYKLLREDDVPLLDMLLSIGRISKEKNRRYACYRCPWGSCRSIEAVEVLNRHGFDFEAHSSRYRDNGCRVIFHNLYSENNATMLEFFLPYFPLSKDNKFGHNWFESLASNYSSYTAYKNAISILLKNNCYYENATQQKLFSTLLQRIQSILSRFSSYENIAFNEARNELKTLFDRDQKKRNQRPCNVAIALQQRARTGKWSANMHPLYKKRMQEASKEQPIW